MRPGKLLQCNNDLTSIVNIPGDCKSVRRGTPLGSVAFRPVGTRAPMLKPKLPSPSKSLLRTYLLKTQRVNSEYGQ